MNLEEIKTLDIDGVEKRISQIKEMDLEKVEDCTDLLEEVSKLEERKKEILKATETKKEIRTKLANGELKAETKEIEKPKGEVRKMFTEENYLQSKEYRSAFFKKMLGKEKEMDEVEQRALAMSNAEAIIPTETQNEILKKAKEYAPVLNEITLLNVNGNVRFAVENQVGDADVHAENATINAKDDSFVQVELSTFEITKMIRISASVKSMSIDAFETWLVANLAESIAMKIENLVFNGTGVSQAKGIDKITWDAKNSVEVANASSLTANDVFRLFGLLKTAYSRGAKMFMNRTTLFGDFLPLQDKAKNDLVHFADGKYYVLGVEVVLTDSIKEHEAILGNMKKYVANMAQSTAIINQFDIDSYSYKYLGVAQFDGKPAIEEAFVKLKKALA